VKDKSNFTICEAEDFGNELTLLCSVLRFETVLSRVQNSHFFPLNLTTSRARLGVSGTLFLKQRKKFLGFRKENTLKKI